MSAKHGGHPDAQPDGNKQKFAWIYALAADTSLSDPAKVIATTAALKLAGRKGYFKATHKALANLCGMHQKKVQRAVGELAAQHYWDVEVTSGGANEYFIIHPDGRAERWLEAAADYRRACQAWIHAESNYKRLYEKWLDAERKFEEREYAQKWLDAESDAKIAYTTEVFSACYRRGATFERASLIAEVAWEAHQADGLPLDAALASIKEMPQEKLTPETPTPPDSEPAPDLSIPLDTRVHTPGHQCPYPWTPVSIPLDTADSVTSANDHSHKSFKSLKTYKDSKGEHAPRALDARSAGPPKNPTGCRLCDGAGTFMDRYAYPVVLFNDEDDEEYEVECQHSMAGNLAEIRRIESESEGFWGIARTGWREIDSQYPHLASAYDDEEYTDE